MSNYVTVSAKVRREVKAEAERLGIRISEVLRKALEEEVRLRQLAELEGKISEVKEILDKLDTERIVKSIREDRESR